MFKGIYHEIEKIISLSRLSSQSLVFATPLISSYLS